MLKELKINNYTSIKDSIFEEWRVSEALEETTYYEWKLRYVGVKPELQKQGIISIKLYREPMLSDGWRCEVAVHSYDNVVRRMYIRDGLKDKHTFFVQMVNIVNDKYKS